MASINTHLKEVSWEEVDWIHLDNNRDTWMGVVNKVINIPGPLNAGNFWTSCDATSLARRTTLHLLSYAKKITLRSNNNANLDRRPWKIFVRDTNWNIRHWPCYCLPKRNRSNTAYVKSTARGHTCHYLSCKSSNFLSHYTYVVLVPYWTPFVAVFVFLTVRAHTVWKTATKACTYPENTDGRFPRNAGAWCHMTKDVAVVRTWNITRP